MPMRRHWHRLVFTWQARFRDPERGCTRRKLTSCAPGVPSPVASPNTEHIVRGIRDLCSCFPLLQIFSEEKKKKASSKSSKTDQAICTDSPRVQKAAAECEGLIWSPSSVIPSLSLSIILLFSRLICTMGKNQQRLKNVQFEAEA